MFTYYDDNDYYYYFRQFDSRALTEYGNFTDQKQHTDTKPNLHNK